VIPLDITALRLAVEENRYLITQHAQARMGLRKITHENLKYVVATGDVVEQYPENQPDPKALFMAHVTGEPLYVSCAFDGTHQQPWGGELYEFENVPALVCCQCGEVWLEAGVAQLIDRIIQEHPQPTRFHQVPVFSLAEFSL
jgi:hypothetical protein